MAVFTGSFLSSALGRQTSVSVIMPHDAMEEPPGGFPVLYLLHGYTDDCRSWLYRSGIERYALERGICVIMPEADNSFYTDMVYGPNYFTYITGELPTMVQQLFRVFVGRDRTFIAGISMGGYGALKCALTKPEQYIGCIALSPVVDLVQAIASPLGGQTGRQNWKGILGESLRIEDENDLFRIVEAVGVYAQMCPQIYIACGKNDELFDENLRLKEALDKSRIDFTFEQANAGHEWPFWDVAIQRGLDVVMGK